MTEVKKTLTIYYDGACPLCSMEIAQYRKEAGAEALCFVDASAKDCDLGQGLTRETALARFHLRDEAGQLISGARAFAHLWAALPRWRWAARLARLPGLLPFMELGYRGFLRVRPLLARMASRSQRRA